MISLVCLAVIGALAQPVGPGQELVMNGGCEKADAAGKSPAGWRLWGNCQWLSEKGNHFLRVRDDGGASQKLKLRPEWWKLQVSVRVRCQGVKRGEEGWHDARVAMTFQDDKGKRVGAWPQVLHWLGSCDWKRESRVFTIPRGASVLDINCCMFSAKGTVDYDDLSVKVVALWPKRKDARPPVPLETLWAPDRAWRQETATRGKICINGLWQFYPLSGDRAGDEPPASGQGWGWMKVPGNWAPGSGTAPIGPQIWEAEGDVNLAQAMRAWYKRRVRLPASWRGRIIYLRADNVTRFAVVYVNGKKAGRIDWPGGEVVIRDLVTPGQEAEIALLVDALPIAPDKWAKKTPEEKAELIRKSRLRGLAGDVYLEAEPGEPGARIADVLLMTSVRKKALGLRFSLASVRAEGYVLDAEVRDEEGRVAKSWRGIKLAPALLRDGYMVVWLPWENPRLWDLRRPYFYDLQLRLRDAGGGLLDETLPVHFGFREFWVEGRRAMLNGHPVHLRAFDMTNLSSDGGLASDQACEWTLRRYAEIGMNFVYMSQYDLDWGQIRYFPGVLRAADKLGMLVSVCMPHPKNFESELDVPDGPKRRYWEKLADWVAREAENHPCVIMYAMSHNHLGYAGDQNPRYLDASFPEFDPSLGEWRLRARKAAQWATEYVKKLDPTRVVYHHQCGNFGAWYTINCYLNFVPIQERMEWLSRYYHAGKKPLFMVEFGMPHRASFQRHRGAPFIWRNKVHAEPLTIEIAAMLFGDRAYDLTPDNLEQYDRMAQVYAREGTSFYFWEVFNRNLQHGYSDVQAEYTRYTWPAFRTWELAAVGPWDWGDCGSVEGHRVELKTNWPALQQPKMQPDYVQVGQWYDQPPGQPVKWTLYGQALRRCNQDLLAYIAGKPEKFTSRDHIFRPGERVRKQLVFINDTATARVFTYTWRAELGGRRVGGGSGRKTVGAGQVMKVPVGFSVPAVRTDARGCLTLAASVGRQKGENLRDEFSFRVLVPRESSEAGAGAQGVVVLDPAGVTTETLKALGLRLPHLDPEAAIPRGTKGLLVGREALRADEAELLKLEKENAAEQALPPAAALARPSLATLPAAVGEFIGRGGRVVVFEQTEWVLSRRLGFRTAFPGVRRTFVRCPWHPVLEGLTDDDLSLWRGEATLTISHTRKGPLGDPLVDWLGFGNSRVWKWGNYGQAASTIIEKPQRGDFLALTDCEFDLDYSPLLEYRDPSGGAVLFCQYDVSGRSERDPAADRLLRNLVRWAAAGDPTLQPARETFYVGGARGADELKRLGVAAQQRGDAAVAPGPGDLLIVGEDAASRLRPQAGAIASAVARGAIVFCLPQKQEDLAGWVPFEVELKPRQVVYTPMARRSEWLLQGLGPSELHWRGKLKLQTLAGLPDGSLSLPTGTFGAVKHGRGWYVFCQVAPDMFGAADPHRAYLRLSEQRCAQMLARLLANCGAKFQVPLVDYLTARPPVAVNLAGQWRIKADPQKVGDRDHWYAPDLKDDSWQRLDEPGFWEKAGIGLDDYDGVAWLRKHFSLPREIPAEGLDLVLGAVDDEDWTWVNGKFVGHRGRDTDPKDYWSVQRRYRVAADLLHPGDNVIVVKVLDIGGGGGIAKGPLALGQKARWVSSYYTTTPVATDDPYRYSRW